jgi:predicted alpha/beta-hydrolase family hydrolase
VTPDDLALRIEVPGAGAVSALLRTPAAPRACYVFAHGAGAGMTHGAMQQTSEALAARGIATLRFQFPYRERGSGRPDPPALCHAAVRAACAEAARRCPGVPLIAGGRSFGGRMTSQAQALEPLPGVRGLLFFGFPLHPAGQPSLTRADHLARTALPLLFLQGDRDGLAELSLLRPLVASLGPRAVLRVSAGADHSFHVLKRSGRSDAQVLVELADAAAQWVVNL